MTAPIARKTSPTRRTPAATSGAFVFMGSPHSDPGARSPCAPRAAYERGGEQQPEVHSVDCVPEQVREICLNPIEAEARQERTDSARSAEAGRRRRRQERAQQRSD